MSNKFSTIEIVASIFKHRPNKWLTPEFVREESNRICDVFGEPRIGDPGRKVRELFASNALQRDNPQKASSYLYNPERCYDSEFRLSTNVYEKMTLVNREHYSALVQIDLLKDMMMNNSSRAIEINRELKMLEIWRNKNG